MPLNCGDVPLCIGWCVLGFVAFADGSLKMIMLSTGLEGCARWHLGAGHPALADRSASGL
jgi:hypothetical protein